MTTIEGLLTLPSPSSNAFSAFRSAINVTITFSLSPANVTNASAGRSASPPRKIARLGHDSGHQSVSRSRLIALDKGKGKEFAGMAKNDGVIRVSLPGDHTTSEGHIAIAAKEVKSAIITVLDPNIIATSQVLKYESVFASCRTIVHFGDIDNAKALYTTAQQSMGRCVNSLAQALRPMPDGKESVEWLVAFVAKCAWFDKRVALLESLLAHLDRTFLLENEDLDGVRDLAWNSFASKIFFEDTIPTQLKKSVHDWIRWEREHEQSHDLRPALQRSIEYLLTHDQYESLFEQTLLEETNQFYHAESEKLSKALRKDPLKFLDHVHDRIQQEDSRARQMLPERSRSPIVNCTMHSLLQSQLDWLAEQGIPLMMEKRDVGALSIWYKIFSNVQGLPKLSAAFATAVNVTVTGIVMDKSKDEEMVDRLLEFKKFVDDAIPIAFSDEINNALPVPDPPRAPPSPTRTRADGPSSSNWVATATTIRPMSAMTRAPNKDFMYAAHDAFATAFKKRDKKPAEMIAKYLDTAMRRGQRKQTDSEFHALLDSVLALYRFTNDKDVFRAFYMRGLAKRLLLRRSASDDFEKAVLKTLREKYDPEFGMGDHMFNDLVLSRDLTKEFKGKAIAIGTAQKLDEINVLQSSSWPFSANVQSVALPKWMLDDLGKFTDFYRMKHQGRKLEWDHSRSTVRMAAHFSAGKKELSISLYQAVILLLFNDEETLSLSELKEQTQMEDDDLRRTLQTLACSKKRVLLKRPPGPDVNEGDSFSYNAAFEDPNYKVTIPSFQEKETPQEAKQAEKGIEGDRRHYLDAAIVRIMKAKRQVGYEDLKTLVIDAVKKHFIPTVEDIKNRIESLIEQEYMRRDDDDRKKFIYVA